MDQQTTSEEERRPEESVDEGIRKSQNFMIYSQEQAFKHITQARSETEQELYQITDEVLFNVWDALCLSMDQELREEYLPYLPHVFDLLLETDNGDDLWEYLVYIDETKLGNIKNDNIARRRAAHVVDTLLEYKKKILGDSAG